jgi:hypothetical protein
MTVRGEKLGGNPQIGQPTCQDVVGSPFFLGAVGSVQLCWINVKGYHIHTGTARRKHTSGVCGLVRKAYVLCVLGFPYMV